jgi:predicted ArsR family transcriptional regulator
MTPANIRRTSSGEGGGPGTGSWTGAPGSSGSGVRIMAINTGYTLKICPTAGTVKTVNRRESEHQLAVLKALGDETRYAMYEELARSTAALSASELAERLGIHANTVRLHLERLREVGLIDVEAVHRGTVGRPQHLYFLSATAPGLGFDPPAHALLAGLLAAMAERVGADAADAADTGRSWGTDAGTRTRASGCLGALEAELTKLGFEPALESDGSDGRPARIEFLHCPFRDLAEAYPELVCNLHRGLCEGVVDAVGGGTVDEFATLYDSEPCHVTVGLVRSFG